MAMVEKHDFFNHYIIDCQLFCIQTKLKFTM